MAVKVCVDLITESGEQVAFLHMDIVQLLMLNTYRVGEGYIPEEQGGMFRASVVNTATGEVWAVRLPVEIDGQCRECGLEIGGDA